MVRPKWDHRGFSAIAHLGYKTKTGRSEVAICDDCPRDRHIVTVDLRRTNPKHHTQRITQAMQRHDDRYHTEQWERSDGIPSAPPVKRGTAKQQEAAQARRSKADAAEKKRLEQEAKKEANANKALEKALMLLQSHWGPLSKRPELFPNLVADLKLVTGGAATPTACEVWLCQPSQ